jgi:uncharacterized protein
MKGGNVAFEELSQAITAVADPAFIILFGSQARGDTDANSDVDLLVVQEKRLWKSGSRRREIGRLRRALPRIGCPIDLLLFTPSEVSRWRSCRNHVVAEAFEEGKVLYERQ